MGLTRPSEQALIETGIDLLGPVPWGTHVCQFYQTQEDVARVIAPYFKAGLENNEACLWIIPQTLSPPDAAQILRESVPDLDERISHGQMEIVSAGEWYGRSDRFDVQDVIDALTARKSAALSAGYGGLRIAPDCSWFDSAGWNQALEYEWAAGPVMRELPALVLCSYPLSMCASYQLVEMIAYHDAGLVTIGDVTDVIRSSSQEHRKIDDEIRRSQEPLDLTHDMLRVGMWDWDLATDLTAVSGGYRALYGWPAGDSPLTTEDWLNVVYPDDRERAWQEIEAMVRDRAQAEVEFRIVKPDGTIRWIMSRGRVFTDESGKPVRVAGVDFDITRRKNMEDALIEAKTRLQWVLESITQGYYLLDSEWRFVDANPVAEKHFGHSLDELRTMTIWEAAPLPPGSPAYDAYHEALAESKPVHIELASRIRPGMWSELHAYPRDGMLEIYFRDITERKDAEERLLESEQRYRAIVENFEGLIYICSQDYRVEFANQAFIDRAGYDPIGDHCYKALHDRDSICPWCVNERVFRGETVRWEVQSPKDDSWMYVVNTPIHHSDGSVSKHSMILDITERKLAEQQLQEQYHREKEIAEVLQKAILPSTDNSVEGFGIASKYQAAPNQAQVGGDFYDQFKLPDGRTAFVIGDVSGKGVQAAVHTAMAKYMLRAYAHKNPDPAHVLKELNEAVCAHTPDEIFITVIYAALDPATRVITYANAGHDKPLLYRADSGTVSSLDTTGGLLGVLPQATYDTRTIELSPGDFILMYTDGITDAKCQGDFFDVEGLREVLVSNAAHGEEHIANAVYKAAYDFAGGHLDDDTAVVVVRAQPGG